MKKNILEGPAPGNPARGRAGNRPRNLRKSDPVLMRIYGGHTGDHRLLINVCTMLIANSLKSKVDQNCALPVGHSLGQAGLGRGWATFVPEIFFEKIFLKKVQNFP